MSAYQPTYGQTVGRREPEKPVFRTTPPTTRDSKVIQTDKDTYDVIRSVDPRGQRPDDGGMSSGVYLVKKRKNERFYVEKRIKITKDERKERALAEVDALVQVREAGSSYHVNLIYEHFWDGVSDYMSMILEYCNEGTVGDLINRYTDEEQLVPEAIIWHVLGALTKALCFTHYGVNLHLPDAQPPPQWNTVCHLDIKPTNVFLTTQVQKDRFPRVVLGDFGCTVSYEHIKSGKADREVQTHGTPGWLPPELTLTTHDGIRGKYGIPTDIWQMGAVAQVMSRRTTNPVQWLADDGHPCGRQYSRELNWTVGFLMQHDYNKRPTAMQLRGIMAGQAKKRGLIF